MDKPCALVSWKASCTCMIWLDGKKDCRIPGQTSAQHSSSLVAPVQGHSNAAEGASEKQTYSSMESLASLSAAEAPEAGSASHGPKDAQQGRVPLGVSPLSREGAGAATSQYTNGGSMGYAQHLQGGLPGVPSLLQSIWNTSPPPWEASGQPHFAQLPSKPAQRQPEAQMNPMELQRVCNSPAFYQSASLTHTMLRVCSCCFRYCKHQIHAS